MARAETRWTERSRASDAPLRIGNRLTLHRNGPEAFDEWLEEIGRAEK